MAGLIVRGLRSATISSGSTTSNAVGLFDDAWGLTIYSPATVTGTGIVVQVEPTDTGTAWVTLQSGGADVVIPASKATVISPVPFRQLRLNSDATEAQADVFTITKAILV